MPRQSGAETLRQLRAIGARRSRRAEQRVHRAGRRGTPRRHVGAGLHPEAVEARSPGPGDRSALPGSGARLSPPDRDCARRCRLSVVSSRDAHDHPAGPRHHRPPVTRTPKPEWLKVRAPGSENYLRLKQLMRGLGLNTVCEEARCPNIGECWHHGTATFMILGDVCTRACGYCAVAHGRPGHARSRRAGARRRRCPHARTCSYVVITSVDRDDLADGGASIFAETIRRTRDRSCPRAASRCSSPISRARPTPLQTVLDAAPDVLNHNTETVPRLYRMARSGGHYSRTLELLRRARTYAPRIADEDRTDGRPRRGARRDRRGDARPARRAASRF